MSAFFVSSVTIKDQEKFQDYLKRAAQTFSAFGGEPVLRGKTDEVLVGDADFQAVGIVRFPDAAALRSWYYSDAYQALIPLRDEAVGMVLVACSDLV